MPPKLRVGGPPGVPPPNDGPEGVVVKSAVNIDRRLKLTGDIEGGSAGEVVSKSAVNINRRLKLTGDIEGGSSGEVVSKSAVNINRRLKSTVRGEGGDGTAVNIDRRLKLMGDIEGDSSGTPPHNDPPCCVCNLAASARSAESSFSETDEATEQLHTKYLASLSLLEQRVCSIARDHLESSFDLSRSTGFVAWVGKK
jgi:hypothetical protein